MSQNLKQTRALTIHDMYAIERLLRTSEYIYQRFTLVELPLFLKRDPAVGIFHNSNLYGFLLSQVTSPQIAWISGFGVSWSESKAYQRVLSTLLPLLGESLQAQGITDLHYSGNDAEHDWLRPLLLARGFSQYRFLYAYDKYDYTIPASGNAQVVIRPFDPQQDMPAVLAIEAACFEALWRYDQAAFSDIAATHPYFVVAEMGGNIVGYQFNAIDDEYGYLVRIAVHPRAGGQGVGTRLMAEAMRFFREQRVSRIMLNTQEENSHAHRLYEWFGFIRLPQKGFVLHKTLTD